MNQPFGARAQMRLPAVVDLSARSYAGSRLRRRARNVRLAFVVIVLLPTALAAVYTAFLATPRYVSEGQFVVRGVASGRATGLESLFRSFGLSRTVDDANVVQSYIQSRDAVRALEQKFPLRAAFQRPDVDRLARFPRPWEWDSDERFYKYYLDRVSVVQDGVKGISTVKVVAFDPNDAKRIAEGLLALAEDLANRLNLRAQHDLVASAEAQVAAAEKGVIASQSVLTEFRNQHRLVDPGKSSDLQLGTITTLASEYAETLAQIQQLTASAKASPAIASLKAKADALQDRIAAERSKLAGSDEALAGKVSEYEKLTLNRDIADKTLAASIESLELARQEARRQQIYVEQIVAPHLPDEPTEPDVLRTTATFFVLGFALFSVLWIISVGAQEHEQ